MQSDRRRCYSNKTCGYLIVKYSYDTKIEFFYTTSSLCIRFCGLEVGIKCGTNLEIVGGTISLLFTISPGLN